VTSPRRNDDVALAEVLIGAPVFLRRERSRSRCLRPDGAPTTRTFASLVHRIRHLHGSVFARRVPPHDVLRRRVPAPQSLPLPFIRTGESSGK
jgi:hypothetical protein